jgi:hypothetical protein
MEHAIKNKIEDDLYATLIFIFNLPSSFVKLTDQKDDLNKLNKSLLKGIAITNKDYSDIKKSIRNKLFELIKIDLFPEETDSKINLFFMSKLVEKLRKYDVQEILLNEIAEELINFQSSLNKQIKAEPKIKKMIGAGISNDEDDVEICKNTKKSANDTYIVTDNKIGKKYYAKTFDEAMSIGGKLNPNELFLYKVMEYTGFGPKTNFLIEAGSSSKGKSSIYKGNFILTEDVCQLGQEFFLDLEENRTQLTNFAIADSKKFAVEISAAVALTDILSVTDVFGKNVQNYGVVGNANNPSDYKIQFVDHQPDLGNGLFSTLKEEEKLLYSPRESLPKKYPTKVDNTKELTPLAELALKSKGGEFVKKAIQDEVYERIFMEQKNKNNIPLEKAIDMAYEDVKKIINVAGVNFVNNAVVNYLDKYIEKIKNNTKTYYISVGKSSQATEKNV